MSRWRAFAAWLLPIVVLSVLYRNTFDIWFREDDFPLLDFMRRAHSFREFLSVAFIPYAQGTIRPLSERLPFFLSTQLFGLDCRALRGLVFATACGDLLLINWITRRLTGSRLAGSVAALLWAMSAAIVSPMTWNSSYNEVQYPLFLLCALALFIRYEETGRKRYWWLQLVVFLLGFGSLENMVLYPAIVLLWLLFGPNRQGKKLWLGVVPLFAASAIYAFVHLHGAPTPADGPYQLHIDRRIFKTLWEYSRWAILSPGWRSLEYPRLPGSALRDVAVVALIFCVAAQALKRSRTVWFCLGWFLVTLSLFLPLPDRHTEYYLAAPEIGLCMLAASGAAIAWKAGAMWRLVAAAGIAAWCGGMLPVVIAQTARYVQESRQSRSLILGARDARGVHPGKAIFIAGVTDKLYGLDFFQNGFEAAGIDGVYIAPDANPDLHPAPGDGMMIRLVPDAAVVRHAVKAQQAVAYRWTGDRLQDISADYALPTQRNRADVPSRIRVGDPLYAYTLGKGWGGIGNAVRWMPAEAELSIAGPEAAGEHLSLTAYCLGDQLKRGPLHLTVTADGIDVGKADVLNPETEIHRRFALPDALLNRKTMTLRIAIDPVIVIAGQPYGALFGDIQIEP